MPIQNDTIEILEKVNGFYDSAWNRLIVFSSVLIALVGIVLPLIINWWQNRTLKIREDSIRKDFQQEFNRLSIKIREEFKDNFEKIINQRLKELDDNFEKKLSTVDAGTFHIQGNNSIKEKEYKDGIVSFLSAAKGYFKGDDYNNLNRINGLIKENLKFLNKDIIAEMELEGDSIVEYLQELKSRNDNGLFTDVINDIRKEYEKAKTKNSNGIIL